MKKDKPMEKNDIKAFLGPGSIFEGKLIFNEIVRMDGVFKGEVESEGTLIAGETSEVQGEIKVGVLIVSGNLKGNVKASKKVELRKPANVEGNINTPILVVEEGVTFNGNIQMGQSGKTSSEKIELSPKKL